MFWCTIRRRALFLERVDEGTDFYCSTSKAQDIFKFPDKSRVG